MSSSQSTSCPAGFINLEGYNVGDMKLLTSNNGRQIIAFQGANDPFSNFFYSPFVFNGETFSCVEQAFVVKKLEAFGLNGMASEARKFVHQNSDHPNLVRWGDGNPRELKWLGREGEEKASARAKASWSTSRQRETIASIVEAKFRQNDLLLALLVATRDIVLAEACRDRKWAVGCRKNEAALLQYSPGDHSFGQNWMGVILTDLRDRLIEEQREILAPPANPIENHIYLVAQELEKGLVGARIDGLHDYPYFVLLPNELVSNGLGLGDFFRIGEMDIDHRFAELASNVQDATKEKKLWINPHTSILAIQAVVLSVKETWKSNEHVENGTVVETYERMTPTEVVPKYFMMATATSKCPTKIIRRQANFPLEKFRRGYQVKAVVKEIRLPTGIKIHPSFILPGNSPYKWNPDRVFPSGSTVIARAFI